MKHKKYISAACTILLASAVSQAATIVGVTIEDFSSERGGFSRFASNTLDGDINTNWQRNNDSVKTITFNLGDVYSIDSFFVANYSISVDNSDVEDITFNYGLTNTLGSTLGTYTFAARADAPSGETINLGTTISAQYVQFDIDTLHFADASSNDRAGLAEVSFNAVPEPSAFALLAGMFGLAIRLLGIETAEPLHTHPFRGPLFENWVIVEILKKRFNRGLRNNLSFWRNNAGHEIDLLADNGGRLTPIEIRYGQTFAGDWLDGLHKWLPLAGERVSNPTLF